MRHKGFNVTLPMPRTETNRKSDIADVIEGYAVLTRALGTIGVSDKTDHALAMIIVEGEVKIRALLAYSLRKLAIDNPDSY